MGAGDLALRIIISVNGGAAIAGLAGVEAALGGVGDSAGAAGRAIMLMLGIMAARAIIGFAQASIQAAGDFQQQMLHIQALAGMTAAQYTKMTQVILAMAPQVGQAPVDLAKGLFQIVSSLIPANQWTQTLYESAILATTGMANEVDVAKILATIMNIYGMSASAAANDVTLAVTYGRMTMQQYANSIGLVVQKGKAAGFSFNELNAALDVMTTHGFPSSAQAARNLGQLFVQMDLNMDSLATRAQSMGLKFSEAKFKTMDLAQQIAYLTQVTGGNDQKLHKLIGGGVYAFQTFVTLRGAMSAYMDILGKLGGAQSGAGAAMAAWAITQQGFNVKMEQFQALLQVIQIIIGNALFPVLENLLGVVTNLGTAFVGWATSANPIEDALGLMGKYSQIVLPILAGLAVVIASFLVPAIWSMTTALLMSPITWIALAVAGIVALFVHWYQTNTVFRGIVDRVWASLQQLGGYIQANLGPIIKQIGGWIQANVMPQLTRFGNWLLTSGVPALQRFGGWLQANVLPILQQFGGWIMTSVLPALARFGSWIMTTGLPALQQFAEWLGARIGPPLKALGGWIMTSVLPALQRFGGWIVANVLPALGRLGSYIAANFLPWMQNLGHAFDAIGPTLQRFGGWLQQNVWPILQQIGSFLAETFKPVWDELVKVWQTQVMPMLGQLWTAIQPLIPPLELLGKIVGGILVVAFTLLVGILGGIIKVIANVLKNVISFIGGFIQFFTGIVQIVVGVFKGIWDFIYGIFTGNFKPLFQDLQMIIQGIRNTVGGFFQMLGSVIQGTLGSVWQFVKGFFEGIGGLLSHFGDAGKTIVSIWQGVSSFIGGIFSAIGTGIHNFIMFFYNIFKWIYDKLIGHSIVPDMINGIITWFLSFPGKIISGIAGFIGNILSFFGRIKDQVLALIGKFIHDLVHAFSQGPGQVLQVLASLPGRLMSFFGNLANQAIQWGANILKNLAGGILSNIGSTIGNAMSGLGTFIHDHLPHSPAKLGPLRDLALQGSMIPDQIARGMLQGTPRLKSAMSQMLTTGISQNNTFALPGSPNAQQGQINMTVQLDGRVLTQALGVRIAKEIRIQGNVKK